MLPTLERVAVSFFTLVERHYGYGMNCHDFLQRKSPVLSRALVYYLANPCSKL
jgi:hypothetical protein